MQIAIIGSGNVGSALGRAFAGLEHDIVFGTRNLEDAVTRTFAEEIGADVASPVDAAARADLVVLAVPGDAAESTAQALGDLSGKILMDTTNPVGPGLLPPDRLQGRSQAERVADAAPGARVVKAFHTLAAEHMGGGELGGHRVALFLCGDDAEAKQTVADLAEGLGFDPVDVGNLDRARLTEPLALVWITLAVQRGMGRDFGFAIVRE